jgi:hypothetical protein
MDIQKFLCKLRDSFLEIHYFFRNWVCKITVRNFIL